MGKTVDQSLSFAQNRTLAESSSSEIPLHLLEAVEPLKYTYAGEVQLVDAPYQEDQLHDKGRARKVWMFPLKLNSGGAAPWLTEEQARAIEESHAQIARRLSTAELQARAKSAKKQPLVRTTQASVFCARRCSCRVRKTACEWPLRSLRQGGAFSKWALQRIPRMSSYYVARQGRRGRNPEHGCVMPQLPSPNARIKQQGRQGEASKASSRPFDFIKRSRKTRTVSKFFGP